MDGAFARRDRRWISGRRDGVPAGDGCTWEIQTAMPKMRRASATNQVCVERDELLPDVPDWQEIAGGPSVFEAVARGLAEDGGGIGNENGAQEKSADLTVKNRTA